MSFMTPEQSKMARAGLQLGVRELAEVLGFSTATITRFEKGGDTRVSTLKAMQAYFESRGVQFISPDQAGGPGVRLPNSSD